MAEKIHMNYSFFFIKTMLIPVLIATMQIVGMDNPIHSNLLIPHDLLPKIIACGPDRTKEIFRTTCENFAKFVRWDNENLILHNNFSTSPEKKDRILLKAYYYNKKNIIEKLDPEKQFKFHVPLFNEFVCNYKYDGEYNYEVIREDRNLYIDIQHIKMCKYINVKSDIWRDNHGNIEIICGSNIIDTFVIAAATNDSCLIGSLCDMARNKKMHLKNGRTVQTAPEAIRYQTYLYARFFVEILCVAMHFNSENSFNAILKKDPYGIYTELALSEIDNDNFDAHFIGVTSESLDTIDFKRNSTSPSMDYERIPAETCLNIFEHYIQRQDSPYWEKYKNIYTNFMTKKKESPTPPTRKKCILM